VTATNALLGPLFLLAVALLGLAALAPSVGYHRVRPLLEQRGHLAVLGAAFLAAWAVVMLGA
jgi:hypothetical protein